MKTIKIEITIELKKDAGTDWIYNAIEENLEQGEQITDYSIKLLEAAE